jgi:predicted acetyltransferase
MGVEVRTVTKPEVAAWFEAMWAGFLNAPADNASFIEDLASSADLDHMWGGFDGDRVVATLRSLATPVTVPGAVIEDASGVTNVTVAPTHTRRGLLTQMIRADLAACADRGDVVSVLIAAEYPIYGRYGYGPAAERVELTLDATTASFTTDPGGSVELVDRVDYRAGATELYERYRPHQPGAIARHPWWWDLHLLAEASGPHVPSSFFALGYDRSGQVDGSVAYRVEGHWDHGRPRGRLLIDNLIAVDAEATARLWRYCAAVDWIGSVVAENRPVDDPVRWFLTDARDLAQHDRHDLLWLRILDPIRALAGRRYLAPGRVVVDIADPLGHASGRFAVEATADDARCLATDEPADLSLGVSALSSAYLGGYTLADLARAGRVTEHRPGTLAVADAMFRSAVAPWSPTDF